MSLFKKVLQRCRRLKFSIKTKKSNDFQNTIDRIFDFKPNDSPLSFSPLSVEDVSNKVQNNECFFYNKINHGFWDHLIYARNALKENKDFSLEDFEKRFISHGLFHENFSENLLLMLKETSTEVYFHAVSYQAFSGSDQ